MMTAGVLYLVLVLFGFVIGILWMFVPFLIMGTNKRLDRLIEQNALLLGARGIDTSPTRVGEVAGALRSLVTGKD